MGLVELPLFLFYFAYLLSDSVKTNLIVYRSCYTVLNYNKSECALLGTNNQNNHTAVLEEAVEPYASMIIMWHSIAEHSISAISCLFIGPWSDHFGRKPILVLPLIGYVLAYILIAIFAACENLSPWYIIFCAIPLCFTGGKYCYLGIILTYIIDITSDDDRGMRLGFFETAIFFGVFLGNFVSSYLFLATNYSTVFFTSALSCFLGLMFTIHCIPETLTNLNTSTKGFFQALFQISHLVDVLKTAIKKRMNYDRYTILCSALMLSLFIATMHGEVAVMFLYLRENFQWTLKKYTLYIAANSIINALGTIAAIYLFHKLLKVPEIVMIVVGFAAMCWSMVLMGTARSDWDFYLSAIVRAIGPILSPMVHSLVSKMVRIEETGKIFGLIVMGGSVSGMIGSPLYTAIYNSTITTNSSIFNFVSAGLILICLLIAMSIIFVNKCKSNKHIYKKLENEIVN